MSDGVALSRGFVLSLTIPASILCAQPLSMDECNASQQPRCFDVLIYAFWNRRRLLPVDFDVNSTRRPCRLFLFGLTKQEIRVRSGVFIVYIGYVG
jgi:hypothetical protein